MCGYLAHYSGPFQVQFSEEGTGTDSREWPWDRPRRAVRVEVSFMGNLGLGAGLLVVVEVASFWGED